MINTTAAMQAVRNKILDGIVWKEPRPRTPEAFTLYIANALDEPDFRVLGEIEERVGEQEATAWLRDIMKDAGCVDHDAECADEKEAA